MAETQTYNHNDIQRYLQHKMTPQEMHDFEKTLMNDPFLADALDGFLSADANLAEKHLYEIESRLAGQKEKAKVVAMPLQKKAWWKVAAVVFFAAAGGAFFYSLMIKSGNDINVARQETTAKAAEKKTIPDSIGPVEKPLAQVDILPKKIPFKKRTTPIIAEAKESPMAMQSMKADSLQANAAAKKEEDVALLNRSNAVSRLAAPRASMDTQQEMAAGKMAASPSQPPHEFDGKVSDEKAVATSLRPRLKDNEAEATPEGGWKYFENYVMGQVDSFKTNVGNKYSNQEVELEFSIDNNGRPANIILSSKADKIIAEKAIEILKSGPNWKINKKDKTVKLVIPF